MSATLEAARRSAVTLEIRAPAVSDKTFIYTQGVPSTQWIVRHTLNKYPSVTVVDSAGSVVIGNLPAGTYTVTEDTGWSWRYTAVEASKTVDLTEAEKGTADFQNYLKTKNWVDGSTSAKNHFTGKN